MDCSGDSNVISMAVSQLKALARVNVFKRCHMRVAVCSVLYHISLRILVYISTDSNEMRQKVADHLEANTALYCDFLCQPVPSEDDDCNADTKQPTAEDDSIADPQLQIDGRNM